MRRFNPKDLNLAGRGHSSFSMDQDASLVYNLCLLHGRDFVYQTKLKFIHVNYARVVLNLG